MPIIRDIIFGAAAHGAQPHDLCRKLKIDLADLNNSEKHSDFETSCKSWEYAVKATGDPLLGLHIGQSSTPSIMGLVGYLMQNSTTLIDAFRQVCEHGRVATNMFDYRIVEKKDQLILQYIPAAIWTRLYPNGARQATDQAMAGTLNVFLLLSGRRITPIEVDFSIARRKDRRHYEQVFEAPLMFDKPVSQLVFRREDLSVPVLNHDESLFRVFEQLVKEKLRKGAPRNFEEELHSIILQDFKGQVPPLEVLAARMNMAVRSMQRKLAAEKTSFRRIAGQIRKEIASRLLTSTDQKVGAVARLVGYSTPRAFRRAYKVWTRRSPSEARDK